MGLLATFPARGTLATSTVELLINMHPLKRHNDSQRWYEGEIFFLGSPCDIMFAYLACRTQGEGRPGRKMGNFFGTHSRLDLSGLHLYIWGRLHIQTLRLFDSRIADGMCHMHVADVGPDVVASVLGPKRGTALCTCDVWPSRGLTGLDKNGPWIWCTSI